MAILAFQKPDKVLMLEADNNFGKFEFRPLEPGYGVTVGNALRRILLSSLEGFAICNIRIDGVKHEFDNVWIAPTMKGRFYGGGMNMAPAQDRFSDKLTVVVYHCPSKLKALIAFPSIFKGEHVKKAGIVQSFTGSKIHVRFSRPCAGQIDGETVLNMTEYTAVLPK